MNRTLKTAPALAGVLAFAAACGEPPQERQEPIDQIERSLEANEEIIGEEVEDTVPVGGYPADTLVPEGAIPPTEPPPQREQSR